MLNNIHFVALHVLMCTMQSYFDAFDWFSCLKVQRPTSAPITVWLNNNKNG